VHACIVESYKSIGDNVANGKKLEPAIHTLEYTIGI
jgi:hypothetical protein